MLLAYIIRQYLVNGWRHLLLGLKALQMALLQPEAQCVEEMLMWRNLLDSMFEVFSYSGTRVTNGSSLAGMSPCLYFPGKGTRSFSQGSSLSVLIVMVLTHGSGSAIAESSSSLLLVENGQPACTIVIPNERDEWTSKAANWLQEYVRKASGAELMIVRESQAPAGTLISVGHTKLAREADIDVSDLKWDGSKQVVKENVLYLIGRDQKKLITAYPWVGAKGTCRAVLKFLEDICGVRWFLPTPQGELVPHSINLSVPTDWSRTFVPAFAYTDGRSTYNTELEHPAGILNEPGGTPASLANNYRKAMIITPGGHTYYISVPTEKYFGDHPEYFRLVDGKRSGQGNHLCISNPEVKRLILNFMRKRFDEGWECQSIGQEDGFMRCECEDCERLDDYRFEDGTWGSYEEFMNTELRDHPCERLWILNKEIIDELQKSHPDHKVVLMCFGPTAWPSKKIDYMGDNVLADVHHPNLEYIKAWRGRTAGMMGKTDWFNTQCPMGVNVHMSPRELSGWVRQLHENGIIGISQYGEGNWGLQGPLFYLLGRLLGDPSQDYQTIVDEYCQGVYGNAGDSMRQFFDTIYARVEVAVPIEESDLMFSARNVQLGLTRTPTEVMLDMYTPQVLEQLDGLLRQAEGEADTQHSIGWVRLTRDQFDFINLLVKSLTSYRDYEAQPSTEKWLQVKSHVEKFNEYRLKILTYSNEYIDEWFPGHAEYCKYLSGGAIKETVSYYVLWEQRTPSSIPALAGRKVAVLQKGIQGVGVGHGDSNYYSFFKEPFTLDFSEPSAE